MLQTPIRFELKRSPSLAVWLVTVHGGGAIAALASALPAAAVAARPRPRGGEPRAWPSPSCPAKREPLRRLARPCAGASPRLRGRAELRGEASRAASPPPLAREPAARVGYRPHRGPRATGRARLTRRSRNDPALPAARWAVVSLRRSRPAPRRLARIAGERRGHAELGEPNAAAALRRDLAVHDAVRLLDLVPATRPESGYDARGSGFRYRIAGCIPADFLVAAGAFPSGRWDRGLLVFMSAELEPLAIDELSFEAARATRSVARLRVSGRRRWERG